MPSRSNTIRKHGAFVAVAALAAFAFIFWVPSGYALADPSTETRWGNIYELMLSLGVLSIATAFLDRSGSGRSELAMAIGVGTGEILPSLRQVAIHRPDLAAADWRRAVTALALEPDEMPESFMRRYRQWEESEEMRTPLIISKARGTAPDGPM